MWVEEETNISACCGISMWSLCLLGFLQVLQLPQSSDVQVRLAGLSKLAIRVDVIMQVSVSVC